MNRAGGAFALVVFSAIVGALLIVDNFSPTVATVLAVATVAVVVVLYRVMDP